MTKTPEVKVSGMPPGVLKQKQATANAPPKTKLKGVKESNVLANTGVFSNPYCAKNSSHIVHTESKDQLERDVKEIWRDYDQEFAVIVSDIEDDIKTKKINAKEAAESFKSVLTKFLESKQEIKTVPRSEGGLMRKITRNNSSQNEENPLPYRGLRLRITFCSYDK